MRRNSRVARLAFTLVEVVLAMGLVSFSVLATVGLLSVANDTNARARDETFAAQIVSNEFQRLRSLSAVNFPATYVPRFYDSNLTDLGTTKTANALYELRIDILPQTAPAPADNILNAEVRYPANATFPNIVRFTSLINTPKP